MSAKFYKSVKKKLPISAQNKANGTRSEESDFFKLTNNTLCLEDGTVFDGVSPIGQSLATSGEIVFNTGMSGYVESLTDPSYESQILVFTYPLIGNYGVRLADVESSKIQVRGVVMGHLDTTYNPKVADMSLPQWLKTQSIFVLSGVDTRSLTKYLRSQGTMQGTLGSRTYSTNQMKESRDKSQRIVKEYNRSATKKIILIDCGAKENILRSLLRRDYRIKRVSAGYDFTDEIYDGIVISNGPGDPTDYTETITIVGKAMTKNKPIFGICLGSQIMALAAGAQTYKLKFGHRGHNQPCIDIHNQHCYMTSQNHGYAVDEHSLPPDWEVQFRNLNDRSVEGIRHTSKPFFAVQFHPEASPGPTDTAWLFNRFDEHLHEI